jgi:hypothetical protein
MTRIRHFVCALVLATGLASPALAQVTEPTKQLPATLTAPAAPATMETLRFGVGGAVGGSALGAGASVRNWFGGRVGAGFELSHFSLGYFDEGISVTQLSPLVLVRFTDDRIGDDVMFRPYVGGGLNFYHTSVSSGFYGESNTSTGLQIFVGTEMVFRALPRFGISADLGFHSTGDIFEGTGIGGIGLRLVGHYYIKK